MRFIRYLLSALVAVTVLSSTAVVVSAQPSGAPVDKRERVKQKVRTMRAYFLTDALNLDPTTAGKMFPVIEKYDSETDALAAARVALRAKLETTTDGKALNKVIDDLVANQKATFDVDAKRLAELRAILSPQQVGKLMIVLPEFEKRLQNRLGKVDAKAKEQENGNSELGGYNPPTPRQPKAKSDGKKRKCDPFSDPVGCRP